MMVWAPQYRLWGMAPFLQGLPCFVLASHCLYVMVCVFGVSVLLGWVGVLFKFVWGGDFVVLCHSCFAVCWGVQAVRISANGSVWVRRMVVFV